MATTYIFSEIASRLELALSTLDDATSTDDIETVSELLLSVERETATCRAFLEARAAGANVHPLTPAVEREPVSRTRLSEAYAAAGVSFALAASGGETYSEPCTESYASTPTPIRSTWDDGREFQWVGSQCIVSR